MLHTAPPPSLAARLGASSSTTTLSSASTTPAVPDASLGAQQRIVSAAATSLAATFSSLDAENPLFPDVIDARTGVWHTDDVSANGAAGLLAGACVRAIPAANANADAALHLPAALLSPL